MRGDEKRKGEGSKMHRTSEEKEGKHRTSAPATFLYSIRRQPSSMPSASPPAVPPRVAHGLFRAGVSPRARLAACALVAPAGR